MPNDAYEHMKMLLNVNKNAKNFIESELRANVRFLELKNASSRDWSWIHANECVFSRNEEQKVNCTEIFAPARIQGEISFPFSKGNFVLWINVYESFCSSAFGELILTCLGLITNTELSN